MKLMFRDEGRAEGRYEGPAEGIGIGRREKRNFILNSLISGYRSGSIKLEFAAQLAGMSKEEFMEKIRRMLIFLQARMRCNRISMKFVNGDFE